MNYYKFTVPYFKWRQYNAPAKNYKMFTFNETVSSEIKISVLAINMQLTILQYFCGEAFYIVHNYKHY